ncbi:threonine transporter RhtB [Rubrobacter xylanophilus]|uniref:Threonine transporter RhtB n=1 Tax=Rubrobacter xylanophilus TaxID=49319 RepID=A0A510HL41_9ACTN|nr:EamA family transporter [Rubrobacter xylanophilus]BBL80568.1 threonine transporter RhtB [Rubrobacter xylanophilus]
MSLKGSKELAGAFPPEGLVLLAVCSVQLGAAVAKGLFEEVGPGGTVFLRVGFAAVFLLLLWRPEVRGYPRSAYRIAVSFGAVLAAMNLSFYAALDRIPLGVAVTLEFVGPLGVAVAGSRRGLDVLWVLLAASGILLLAPLGTFGGADLDPVGVGLALLAGGFWAGYILLGARTGRVFPGSAGLVVAMCAGAMLTAPVGLVSAGGGLLDWEVLLAGAAVALLSSAVPYSLELEALRRLPSRVFGVLMSLEPAVAALVGFLVLGERLGWRAVLAVLLVTLAAAGASRSSAAQ